MHIWYCTKPALIDVDDILEHSMNEFNWRVQLMMPTSQCSWEPEIWKYASYPDYHDAFIFIIVYDMNQRLLMMVLITSIKCNSPSMIVLLSSYLEALKLITCRMKEASLLTLFKLRLHIKMKIRKMFKMFW